MHEWGAEYKDIQGIAATAGPGLVGALLVGLHAAKGLALGLDVPLVAVNHLEGHLWVHRLEGEDIEPPFLALIVSGGHTELIRVAGFGEYEILSRTRDDAAGEALDKVGKLFGLDFPAGPEIDRISQEADRDAFRFPRGMIHDGLDFSFSGLKTAVRIQLEQDRQGILDQSHNVLAGVQEAVMEVLATKVARAVEVTGIDRVCVSGGVAANSRLREMMLKSAESEGFQVRFPSRGLCTDNAAMIAWVGRQRLIAGEGSGLDVPATPGWALETLTMITP
jgi:N6-L-threonylcarbamoyladenine synthase